MAEPPLAPGAPYPWLQGPWLRLTGYRQAQRLPHAILVVGHQGVGKRRLAESFASLLLCQQPGASACGSCSSCRLLAADTHPDYLVVQPAETGKVIGIDAVRQLIDKLALKPQYGGYRVVLFDPADAFNAAAANALLKILEEPPEQTLMLLLSAMPSRVLPTLSSRCQRLPVAPPPKAAALDWLRIQEPGLAAEAALAAAGGAPLNALAMAASGLLEQRARLYDLWPVFAQNRSDPVQAAESLANVPIDALLDWLYSWTCDVLKLAVSAAEERLVNGDRKEQLGLAARALDPDQIAVFADTLRQCKRQAVGNAQLNRQLLVEEILIAWRRLAKPDA